jgi:dTDP-glucose 4,6-dehydratase
MNKNLPEILTLLDKEQPEYIVNFASQSMVGESWDNPVHWYQTNVVSIVGLTNALKEKKYLKKYVHISTPEVYGSCSGKVTEDYFFNPSSPYAGSRAAADNFIQMLVKQFGFPAVFTRAANVYGPGQQLFKIIPRSIVNIKLGKKIPLHGGGEARRSFIHIVDVCEGTLRIMEHAKSGEIYHLSTNVLVSIKDLVKIISDTMNVDFTHAVEIVQTRRGLDNAYILDSTKAIREFGWVPAISLEEGISDVITWVTTHWNLIEKEPLEYQHIP